MHVRKLLTKPSPSSSSSSWTLAIRNAVETGHCHHALTLYIHILRSGHKPGPFAIAAVLKACTHLPSKPIATSIHSQILKLGHHSDVYPQTALLSLYSKLEGIFSARKLFDEMTIKNVVSWNTILASHVKAGELEKARRVFEEMPVRDVVTFNSLLSGYAKGGDMVAAGKLFWSMKEKNVASWNGMISGYVENGDVAMARKLFDEMPARSNVSWIAMISGYAKCGDVGSARELFDGMEWRDVFCWNAMIACYAQNGCPREAVWLFNRVRKPDSGVVPDRMTFSSVISACSQLGDLRFGSWLEEYIGLIGVEVDDHLGTALVDLYSKCGKIDRAFELFNGLRKRDLLAYSAMIFGCAINGRCNEAVRLFEEMEETNIEPNEVTFAGILTAYNHAGLVEEGSRCFASMSSKYNVSPSADQYAIMVDLLGRNGRLDDAYQLIRKMPIKPHIGVWGALLLACKLHVNVELGEVAARKCIELEPEATGYYVLLGNIYAESGDWEKAKRLRKTMVEKGFSKMPGCSWLQPK